MVKLIPMAVLLPLHFVCNGEFDIDSPDGGGEYLDFWHRPSWDHEAGVNQGMEIADGSNSREE